MRLIAIAVLLDLLSACSSTSDPIALTIEVERLSDELHPVEITVQGRDFEETVSFDKGETIKELNVPGPGSYSFYTDGIIEESTGLTSGCQWDGSPVQAEITKPTTVLLEAGMVCA